MKQPQYHIIFRTCDLVHSLHNTPRPFDLDKRSLIKCCFKSLYNAVRDYPHSITILGDRLSDELKQFFADYNVTMLNEELGNDASIRRTIELALERPDDEWVYFCEDDYLHTPESFLWMNDLIANREQYIDSHRYLGNSLFGSKKDIGPVPLIIHPPDYPDRYSRPLNFSLLFLTKYCHWRQIVNTTFTFMMQARTVKQYREILLKSVKGANDGYLSDHLYASTKLGSKALCLSPIPGIATHMHEEVMTPLVDWERIYDGVK